MRYVSIEIERRELYVVKGIYRMKVGGKFYIGSAQNLYSRMYSHQNSLERALAIFPNYKQSCSHHYSWCGYICENEGIKTIPVKVMQRCISDSDLYYAEQFYINEYIDHPDCLNIARTVPYPLCFRSGKDKRWELQLDAQGYPEYFDPEDKENTLISPFSPLTCKGQIKKSEVKRFKKECDEQFKQNTWQSDTQPISV